MPGLEAHGGYTFCGTAALVILGKEHMLDLKALLVRNLTQRYCRKPGGESLSSMAILNLEQGSQNPENTLVLFLSSCVGVVCRGGLSTDRCVSKGDSRAAATNWLMAATPTGRPDFCHSSIGPSSKKVNSTAHESARCGTEFDSLVLRRGVGAESTQVDVRAGSLAGVHPPLLPEPNRGATR